MERPKRKMNRIAQFDYSLPNAYFLTLCTKERKKLFWERDVTDMQDYRLSDYGILVEKSIKDIPTHYPAVTLDNYVIMPDHVHLLLQIHSDENGRPMVAPTVATIVQQMKGYISKQIGNSIWQKGFYDHVIRTDAEYREVWEYIDNNPRKLVAQKMSLP